MTRFRSVFALAALLSLSTTVASAQRAPFTGYELALSGSGAVSPGRTTRLRGTAYRVRGLAELVPSALPVRARFDSDPSSDPPWASARSDASGAFVIDVAVPDRAPGEQPRFEIEIGEGDDARRFTIPVGALSPLDLMLRTDRVLYEPGEPVHVWALVRDAMSGRPVVGREFRVSIEGGPLPSTERRVATNEAGVLSLDVTLSDAAPEGHAQVTIDDGVVTRASTSFRVGTRTWERLFATIEVEPDEVPPGGVATAHVEVTAPSGAPVRGARVDLSVGGSAAYVATTDAGGRADVEISAPAYLASETGVVSVRAEITHPAHGSVAAYGYLRLAIPLALSIELVPRHGALVPEIDDVLFVRLHDGAGDPPPAGTELEVDGPGVRAGVYRTDENGIAEVPVRVPRGSSSGDGDALTTSYTVRVRGALERLAMIPISVSRRPEVIPTAARPVVAPGDRVEVTLARRPSSAARVIVELFDDRGELLAVERVGPRESRASFDLPPDRIGLLSVRARAILEDESLEGFGGYDRLLVRPASPAFVRVEAERERWTIGETARVRLITPAGGPRSFGALLVRDLAAHGGEQPFRRWFLDRAFDRALLDPQSPAAERLVRAALAAAHMPADEAPIEAEPLLDELGLPVESAPPDASSSSRSALRDPWPLARELGRRGIGEPMMVLENRLAEALASGGLGDLTEARGGRRSFRDEPLEDFETLGGGAVTPSILAAADPSFTYDAVGRRVARARLVRLMVALAHYLDPGEDASPQARQAALEPWARWLPRMVERGMIEAHELDDPWGGRFTLREVAGAPAFALSPQAARLELVSPGPDGRTGTGDDVRDPFERVVTAGTPYAVASGEDALMRQLAILSPAARTLAAIAEAYTRTNAEMMEEEIGDAVSARVSEGVIGLGGLGTIGHGAGGGGSGYGSGYGRGMMGRRSSAPSIRVGSASVSGLARVVRERFPPTLLFRPTIEIDPSGTTTIEIPLADAVTTYIVEAIVWREDGWIWSDSARIEVDRDIVIDAPVPDVARVGDRVRLPLRVSNRGETPRELRVALLEEPALGIEPTEPAAITLEPGGAAVVPVELALDRVGSGRISVVVTDPEGHALDAVRRPLSVIRPARRVHVERDTLVTTQGEVVLEVPASADPRRGRVSVAVGLAMVPAPDRDPWLGWTPGTVGTQDELGPSAIESAFLIGADWRRRGRVSPRRARPRLAQLTAQIEALGRDEGDPAATLRVRALSLLGLAPIADARRPLPEALALVDRLAREVSSDAASATDDPDGWVAAAAALGWSGRGAYRDRVAELLRRLERHTVTVGEDRWLPTPDAPLRSTALLAMAELSLGRRDRAFVLIRTLARWSSLGHPLPDDARAFARAVADRLMGDRAPDRVTIEIDGAREEVDLLDGAIELDRRVLAEPGRHVVRAFAANGAPLWLGVDADYGVPWPEPALARPRRGGASAEREPAAAENDHPTRAGPLSLRYEGELGGEDDVSGLVLVVRNRSPRTLPAPILEIDLPTGAELTESDRARMGWMARGVQRSDGVLTIRLAPLRPGNEVRIPFPVRWSVAGALVGLGTAAYAQDRPDEVTVLPPRELAIAPREVQ